jgi:hypothetical protein
VVGQYTSINARPLTRISNVEASRVYSVEPINKNGLHAVIELDQSKLKDHPPAEDQNGKKDIK